MLNIQLRPHRASLMAGTPAAQKVFAMLKMIPDPQARHVRSPLAFVLVVDTSGSMSGEKLNQAIEACHKLVDDERLSEADNVAVVHFDSDASILVPLTPVNQRRRLHDAIDSLTGYAGGTVMPRGMACAQDALRRLSKETAKRVVLLTDGGTEGEDRCQQLASEFAEANTPIIAVGIGPEYNENLLLGLAEVTQGRPYHLESMEQLQDILDSEIGSSVKEVVTDLQVKVAQVKGVTLNSIAKVFPSLSEISLDSQPQRLGNIAAGDYTVFIFEFTVEGLSRPASRARIAQISPSGSIQALRRREDFAPQDLFITFTTDEAAVAAVDPEVLGYVQQKNVDSLIQQAMGQATMNAGQAKKTLQVALGMTQRIGNPAMTRVLNNALEELNKTGTISPGTRKTVALGGRTKTVKTGQAVPQDNMPSQDEIRRLSGL